MSAPFLAEIRMFGGGLVPPGWAQCNGQKLNIQQNTALFSLLGTSYGGDGKTTFGLPDFRGSMPIGVGQGNGLTGRELGETTGTPGVQLLQSEMPKHAHEIYAYGDDAADVAIPGPSVILGATAGLNLYGTSSDTTMNPGALAPVGQNKPHNNLPPYQVVNFMIATVGIYPSRN